MQKLRNQTLFTLNFYPKAKKGRKYEFLMQWRKQQNMRESSQRQLAGAPKVKERKWKHMPKIY